MTAESSIGKIPQTDLERAGEGFTQHVLPIGDVERPRERYEQIAPIPVFRRTQYSHSIPGVSVEHLKYLFQSADVVCHIAGRNLQDAERIMRKSLPGSIERVENEFAEIASPLPEDIAMAEEMLKYFTLKEEK